METEEQKEWLERWYGYMKDQQQDNADTQKEKIDARLDEFTDPELKKLYDLLKVRYHLMYEDLEKSTRALAETSLVEEDKYHWLNYYYYFFRGIYHYQRKEYKTAIDWYTKARLFISDIPIEETAELFYKLAAACNRTYEISLSIKHTERALKIFKDKSYYKRVASCESLVGLNNHDIKQFKEAEYHYHEALIYVEKANDKLLKMRILHNLGLLYTEKGDPKAALDYLGQCEKFWNTSNDLFEDHYLKAQTLYLLTKNYFKTDQIEKALQKLHNGLNLASENENLTYFHRFDLLKAKFAEPVRFERAYKEGICYFKDRERWELVIEYGEELASYLRGTGNHEEAVGYFELVSDARNKMKKERELSHD